jgi:hypothetical protein
MIFAGQPMAACEVQAAMQNSRQFATARMKLHDEAAALRDSMYRPADRSSARYSAAVSSLPPVIIIARSN